MRQRQLRQHLSLKIPLSCHILPNSLELFVQYHQPKIGLRRNPDKHHNFLQPAAPHNLRPRVLPQSYLHICAHTVTTSILHRWEKGQYQDY